MTGTMANNEQPPPATVALSYIDVLFGLAAGRAFMSAFDDVSRLSSVEWSHFLVALVLITCSWIGYHLNRSRTHPKEAEFTRDARAPLAQIGIDIALVALYYRLASRIRLDHTTHTELRIVLLVFVLYAVWDFVNLQVSPDRNDTRVRAMVDVAWVGLFLAVANLHLATPWTEARVVLVDVVLMGLLLVYRYAPGTLTKLPSSSWLS